MWAIYDTIWAIDSLGYLIFENYGGITTMGEKKKKEKSGEKRSVKEFIADLKMDPKTLEEAKQKTKSMCILTGIVFGVFVVLFCLLHILLGVLWAAASVGIIAFLNFKWTQKNKRNFCQDCGARFDYEECVAWEVSNVERKTMNPNSNSQSKQAIQKDVATVVFTCTCKDCGSERTFSEKYDVTIWYDDGSRKDINLNNIAKNYFKL